MKILKILAVIILIVAAIGVSLRFFRPLILERNRLEANRNEFRKDNEEMRRKIAELKTKQNDFQRDPEYVEQIGRESNRARPNEVIFVFPEPRE